MTFALGTVVLDGVACYFAAQALGGDQESTLVWTGLFLAVLGGGEFALDYYRDRSERAWHALAILIGVFVELLGTLRFWFLAVIGGGVLGLRRERRPEAARRPPVDLPGVRDCP